MRQDGDAVDVGILRAVKRVVNLGAAMFPSSCALPLTDCSTMA